MKETLDPNAAASRDAGIYGLPYSFDESKLIFLPIPWEATTSYGGGTVLGPESIFIASHQMDLFDLEVDRPYLAGMHLLPDAYGWKDLNSRARPLAQTIIDAAGDIDGHPELKGHLKKVNELSAQLNDQVKSSVQDILAAKKIPALIGGDHSTPFGAYQAAAEHFKEFGILHFDAHSDTRIAYLGFEHSHASIMYNSSTQIPGISKFVQVGIRDFCEQEFEYTTQKSKKFSVYFDQALKMRKMNGEPFTQIAKEIVSNLPQQVWISFDIDGLDPKYCPHTGTPVPGGLDFSEAVEIIRQVAKSGRKIIGFDVVEVAPPIDMNGAQSESDTLQAIHEWDANVGMRLLYKIGAFTLASQGLRPWRTGLD